MLWSHRPLLVRKIGKENSEEKNLVGASKLTCCPSPVYEYVSPEGRPTAVRKGYQVTLTTTNFSQKEYKHFKRRSEMRKRENIDI